MLRHFVILWPAIILGGLTGCEADTAAKHAATASESREFSGEYPIKIVCTTGPVSDMLQNLGGEHLEITALMGPGVDPHLYRAVPADVERLAAADMVFYNGLHLEGRMAEVFEKLSRSKPTYAVSQSLVDAKDSRLRKPPEFEGYYDPHVWHDPKIWADCVKYAAQVLGEFDPSHRDDYERKPGCLLEAT